MIDGPEAGLLPAAVVFDFDGLIIDSEMPIFEMSRAALGEMGHSITIEAWSTVVGLGDTDSHEALCRAIGVDLDQAEFDAHYQRQDRSWKDHIAPLPGVVELLETLTASGVGVGVASSSSARGTTRSAGSPPPSSTSTRDTAAAGSGGVTAPNSRRSGR